ncbi:hypothetical protein GCM10007388_43830 [Pseudoduganella plicata]|nr:hypothetical protein GCM10007388_43830 [Pseudoduganella plicata]
MSISTYNYTGNSLYSIHVQEASSKFNIDSAAAGGSIFLDNADAATFEDGRPYTSKSDVCCFAMSATAAKSDIRVVWSEVYDLSAFRSNEPSAEDERNNRGAPPGAIWCTAIVKVRGELTPLTNKLVLHFLQDGVVIAVLGDSTANRPLDESEVAGHVVDQAKGKTCKIQADNPWYGAAPKKHQE